jgi:YebC/PmpR family DNA-binding regulatory protein
MSGHSKWHSIKHKKAAADSKRAGIFTKLAKNIVVAARLGGGDPDMNFSLRIAIQKAKEVNMPSDNIEKAIKRGTGELEGGEIVEAVYEGFGPGKVGLVIVSQTDNTNRALTDIRTLLNKNGGEMASQGSVSWNFDKKGVAYISPEALEGKDFDEIELELIDAGATDIEKEDGSLAVFTEVQGFGAMLKKLEELGITPTDSGLEYVAKTKKELTPEQEEKLMHLLDVLDDNDDVDKVFHEAQ